MEHSTAADIEGLSAGWLTLGEFAERIGERPSRVKDLIREGRLVTIEVGTPPAARIPAEFVHDGELIKGLSGALTVLADAGFSPVESVRWLLTETEALPGRPVDYMAAGRHTAVKRVAMALAF
ncbi:MAG TPA: Rv2175c family DNA-binding protein [Mycobacteriales bacterium]|nr:Rv2175c family DNA-binding protein [Mycobacteriales bacterium]